MSKRTPKTPKTAEEKRERRTLTPDKIRTGFTQLTDVDLRALKTCDQITVPEAEILRCHKTKSRRENDPFAAVAAHRDVPVSTPGNLKMPNAATRNALLIGNGNQIFKTFQKNLKKRDAIRIAVTERKLGVAKNQITVQLLVLQAQRPSGIYTYEILLPFAA